MITSWPCPRPRGEALKEYALTFDKGRARRLLILPALFDEANKLRRHTVQVMQLLDSAGFDSFLPDLPGCNESVQSLETQNLASWREAAETAARHFGATHLLTIRAGAILAPTDLPGWRYSPTPGSSVLRAMLRARLVGAREAGRSENMDALLETGRAMGIDLAGYRIGPQLFTELERSRLQDNERLLDIPQDSVGGGGLWLRAEPDEAPAQAEALAAILAAGVET